MNEEFYYNLQQSIESRCAWNSGGNCCRGIEEAYKAGLLRAAEIAESMEGSWADLAWNEVCQDIATAIRTEAGDAV